MPYAHGTLAVGAQGTGRSKQRPYDRAPNPHIEAILLDIGGHDDVYR